MRLGETTVSDIEKAIPPTLDCSRGFRFSCPIEERSTSFDLELDGNRLIVYSDEALRARDRLKTFLVKENDKTLVLTFYNDLLVEIVVAPSHYSATYVNEIDSDFAHKLKKSFDGKYKKLSPIVYRSKGDSGVGVGLRAEYLQNRWTPKEGGFVVQLMQTKYIVSNVGLCFSSLQYLTGLNRARTEALCEQKSAFGYSLSYRHPRLYADAYGYLRELVEEVKKVLMLKRRQKLKLID